MKLRPLLLPPELNQERINAVAHLADEIVGRLDSNCDFGALIDEFNLLVARPYNILDFDSAASSMSMEEFGKFALTPEAPYLADLSRQEQLELIWRVGFSEYGVYEEHELQYWSDMLHRNLGGAPLSFGSLTTPEDVLEKALNYKPIAL